MWGCKLNLRKTQAGMSLIEVLISLLLASIIMSSLTELYLRSKGQYLEAEKLLAKTFDLQWVNGLLSDSIRRAGFTPCLGIDQLELVDRRSIQGPIQGLSIDHQPQQGIKISRMSEHFAEVIKIKDSTKILVPHSAAFHENRALLIADCEHAEVHELRSIEDQQTLGSLLILTRPLLFTYSKPVYIGEFLEERWFIKNNINGDKALHYHSLQTEEVTSFIHRLEVKQYVLEKKHFLKILMGLHEGETQQLMVLVRGS